MRRAWFKIKRLLSPGQEGFSLVEVLLAVAIFGVMATAFVGALVYSRDSSASAGDRLRATMLADEGVQAVRNIRDAAYTNLTDGTYGLVQSGGIWTLSGTSDKTDIFTRTVTIATSGTLRRTVTSNVSWTNANNVTRTISSTSELTNWSATFKSWVNAVTSGSNDASSTTDALKVAVSGNYAYVVRNGGTPSFLVVNISNPASPTLAASLSTLAASPTNITVSGNYAYVTTSADSNELQIVNITTPTAPTLVSSYNATGTADGKAVVVSGTLAYLVRATNSGSQEFCIVNVATPASPTLNGSYSNAVTMNDITLNGNAAYIGTSAGKILVMNITSKTAPTLTTTLSLASTTSVNDVEMHGTDLYIGQTSGTLSIYNATTATAPTLTKAVAVTGAAAINDIEFDNTGMYAFVGTAYTTGEFQVINITTLASAAVVKVVDVTGTTSTVNGLAYSPTTDSVVGATAADSLETLMFVKG